MTIEQLTRQVAGQIEFVNDQLSDSPISASNHLCKGIGYVQGVGEMKGYDVEHLVAQLKAEFDKYQSKINR